MVLMWRFLGTILFSRYSSPLNLSDQSTIQFRVLPTDIDILGHMNNGRYLSFLDLARVNYLIRAKLFFTLAQKKIYGVVAGEMIRFKKPINLFKQFQIVTRLIGWDKNFFYIWHTFKMGDELCAIAVVKICFLHKKKGRLTTDDILPIFGLDAEAKELPSWIHDWKEVERNFQNSFV
jgi:acyl-CoA thioesterase FadM